EVYAPFVPIIQSSGTGKTRLLIELCGKMALFYILCKKSGSKHPAIFFRNMVNDLLKEKCSNASFSARYIVDQLTTIVAGYFLAGYVWFIRTLKTRVDENPNIPFNSHMKNLGEDIFFETIPEMWKEIKGSFSELSDIRRAMINFRESP